MASLLRQRVWRSLPGRRTGPAHGIEPGIALRIAVVKTLWLSARHGGWCVVSRGTKVKIARGARLRIAPGARLYLGFAHFTAVPCFVRLSRDAELTVGGTVRILGGTSVFVSAGGRLEIGAGTFINDGSTVTCFDRITIGAGCAISWQVSVLDANVHELTVRGLARPRSQPVWIGEGVWIGTGATVLPGASIGPGAVVGAGSVVTGKVPSGSVVAGSPALVLHKHASWRP
jgi:tetrahydrodipicolinate N-acetyltransferase